MARSRLQRNLYLCFYLCLYYWYWCGQGFNVFVLTRSRLRLISYLYVWHTMTVECRDFKRSLRLCLSIPFIYRYTWAWIRLSGLRTNSQPIYNSYISWHYLHVQVAKGTRAYLLYNVCTPAPYDKLWLIRYENIWARCVVEMITIAECCVSGINALKSGATNDHRVLPGQEWREMIMMM